MDFHIHPIQIDCFAAETREGSIHPLALMMMTDMMPLHGSLARTSSNAGSRQLEILPAKLFFSSSSFLPLITFAGRRLSSLCHSIDDRIGMKGPAGRRSHDDGSRIPTKRDIFPSGSPLCVAVVQTLGRLIEFQGSRRDFFQQDSGRSRSPKGVGRRDSSKPTVLGTFSSSFQGDNVHCPLSAVLLACRKLEEMGLLMREREGSLAYE